MLGLYSLPADSVATLFSKNNFEQKLRLYDVLLPLRYPIKGATLNEIQLGLI